MAFDKTQLSLLNVAPGYASYYYDAGSDDMATVIAASYFDTGPDDAPKLVAEDRIFCKCADGNMLLIVDQVVAATGAISCFFAGGDLPIRTWATGTADAIVKMKVGHYELGSGGATATRGVLPTPYPGARVRVVKLSSATGGEAFDAGASASDISLDASDGAAGGGTGVTYDGVNRRILLQARGEWFEVEGSSATRWRLVGFGFDASAADEGGSRFIAGT